MITILTTLRFLNDAVPIAEIIWRIASEDHEW